MIVRTNGSREIDFLKGSSNEDKNRTGNRNSDKEAATLPLWKLANIAGVPK